MNEQRVICMFFRRGKAKKKKKKKKEEHSESMWDMMQRMSEDFKEAELRLKEKREFIERKRKILSEKGIEIDEIRVEKLKTVYEEDDAESGSMWDMMQRMNRKMQEEEDYLNLQEKALDDAIARIEAGEFKAPVDENKMYAKKKRIVKE